MTEDREKTQLILLRILGVLLIAVGITMLAQQVRGDTALPARIAHAIMSGDSHGAPHCAHSAVHIRKIKLPDSPPAPPAPPGPPRLSF